LCSAGCADAAPLYPTGFLLVGAAGAGVGAALGAVIGSVTPGWRKVFPNQPAKPAPGTS